MKRKIKVALNKVLKKFPDIAERRKEGNRRKPGDRRFPGRLVDKRHGAKRLKERRSGRDRRKS